MEADWTVALAAGDPAITVPWAASGDDIRQCRFVDLRHDHALDRRNRGGPSDAAFALGLAAAERRPLTSVDGEV